MVSLLVYRGSVSTPSPLALTVACFRGLLSGLLNSTAMAPPPPSLRPSSRRFCKFGVGLSTTCILEASVRQICVQINLDAPECIRFRYFWRVLPSCYFRLSVPAINETVHASDAQDLENCASFQSEDRTLLERVVLRMFEVRD